MPVITCPTCGTKLEVDAGSMGQQVQCGSCQQVFTAKSEWGSGRSRNPEPKRRAEDEDERTRRRRDDDNEDDSPRRSRRRRDDDDEDDDYDYAPSSRYTDGRAPSSAMGVTALVLGIATLVMMVCCWPVGGVCAILAVVFGCLSLNTDGRGLGIAGIALGGVSVLLGVAFFLFVGGFGLMNGAFAPGPVGPRPVAPAPAPIVVPQKR